MTRLFSELTVEEQVARDLSADLDDAVRDARLDVDTRAYHAQPMVEGTCPIDHGMLAPVGSAQGWCLGCCRFRVFVPSVALVIARAA